MDAIRAMLEAAATQLRAGRTVEAQALYQRMLELNPDEPEAIHNLGILIVQANRLDEGLKLLARSLTLAPTSIRFLKNYAIILRGIGRSADAVPVLPARSISATRHQRRSWIWPPLSPKPTIRSALKRLFAG